MKVAGRPGVEAMCRCAGRNALGEMERYVCRPAGALLCSQSAARSEREPATSTPRNNDVIYFASRDKNLTKFVEKMKKRGSNQNSTSAYDIRLSASL